ncbi:MAG: HXXEE domain-containing protein [Syntrophaceae bacterium]|nr:HXXEE domain-containing protein [Syntrophaceae bacterium]
MIELLFLLGFSLHNIEEALWLPKWSKHARKYHKEVSPSEFRFAVIIVTAIGYLLTFQYFLFGSAHSAAKYIYLGFILMMVVNVFFPHLIATIVLKKYAPGLITGILLNAPCGIYILFKNIDKTDEVIFVIVAGIILAVVFLLVIKHLFELGKYLFD